MAMKASFSWWLTLAMGLTASAAASAQEALRAAWAADTAAEARQTQAQSADYVIKSGDFLLQATPSLELSWNDNINLSKADSESDFIVTPLIGVNSSYLIGAQNQLNLAADFGYQKYFQHDELSQWYLGSQSALSCNVYVKNLKINAHDKFSYTQDSAQEAAVAGTGNYGTFANTAGLSGTWDLENFILNLGYDHQNTESLSGQFNEINGTTEMVVARAGWQRDPKLALGWESSVSIAQYDEAALNDHQTYSSGVYWEWRPGSYLTIKPRAGYVLFDASQTSATIRGQTLNSWYADLTLAHQATAFVSYSLSAGHEIQPGIESDAIEDYYLRPGVNWNIIKDVTLQGSLFYEHGAEAAGQAAGLLENSFDWYGGELGLSYSPTKQLKLSLNYRVTFRLSNVAAGEYTQNLVGLQVAYTPK